jgi:hypothetical protein
MFQGLNSIFNIILFVAEPHVCTGNFAADFSELCRRNNMTYIPPVVPRPKPPVPAVQQEVSPAKGAKDKGKPAVSLPEPEPEETTEDGGNESSYWTSHYDSIE